MAYKRREPVSEKEMSKNRYDGHYTICQKLREIYAATDDKDIKMDCRIAMAMAKAMHERLKAYKKQQQQDKDK
ncbi:MAG: hypothetical protein GWN94_22915 [Phycisphaerae bacterium]|nr:hypothetical protein [Phycisphaerae bacterium]NIS53914.1 hypothetical protein [Phycisphaerae bacterium]NIX31410.1 hypothetical protein [Phycisphaerae bacterium]